MVEGLVDGWHVRDKPDVLSGSRGRHTFKIGIPILAISPIAANFKSEVLNLERVPYV